MVKKKIMLGLICSVLGLAACMLTVARAAEDKTEKTKVCVGLFDSRAVAIAYAGSDWNEKILKSKMAEINAAKAAGDMKKIEQLRSWGSAQQDKLHKQGFGTASVCNLLEHIKGDIPKIAKDAGVDIIVSKWDVVYQNPSVKFVDITEEIVKPFAPDKKALKSIRSIQTHEPVSEKVLEGMKCESSSKNKCD